MAAVLRVSPGHDKELHIIHLEETQEEVVRSRLNPTKGVNVIPMEEDAWDKNQAYIHRYNTRSSPRYAFAAAVLKMRQLPQNCNHVLHPTTGTACSYRKLSAGVVPGQSAEIWKKSLANEFGRLANGVGTRMPTGTNTIKFITRNQVPKDRKVTYGNMVCDIRPQKAETHQVILTVGGGTK